MQRLTTILLLILPTVPSLCHVDGEVRNPPTVVTLADSIAPLIDRFNADKDTVRFFTILSPGLCALADQRRVRLTFKSFPAATTLEEARAKGTVLARTIVLRIDDMTCLGCPTNVAKTLVLVPGVEFVDVSFDEKLAIVTLGKGKVLNLQTIIQALEKAGYKAAVTKIRDPQ